MRRNNLRAFQVEPVYVVALGATTTLLGFVNYLLEPDLVSHGVGLQITRTLIGIGIGFLVIGGIGMLFDREPKEIGESYLDPKYRSFFRPRELGAKSRVLWIHRVMSDEQAHSFTNLSFVLVLALGLHYFLGQGASWELLVGGILGILAILVHQLFEE